MTQPEFINRIARLKVLVVGDVMLDTYRVPLVQAVAGMLHDVAMFVRAVITVNPFADAIARFFKGEEKGRKRTGVLLDIG